MEKKNGIILNLLILILIGLGGWNLMETHQLSNQVSILTQKVEDGKEIRIDFQKCTETRLSAVERELVNFSKQLNMLEVKLNNRHP